MYSNGQYNISSEYTKGDYLNLKLSTYSSEDDWQRAIAMFESRIEERFLSPIEQLKLDWDKNGFAIMAILCLLIETLAQFSKGKKEFRSRSQNEYVTFLQNNLHSFTNVNDATDFYKNVRCGILHSAQTYDKCSLSPENKSPCIERNKWGMIVSVAGLYTEVLTYYNQYVNDLKNNRNTVNTRSNFITKMDSICIR